MTERTFKTVRVKWVAEPVKTHYSFNDLKDLLPAEDFCKYLKDQKIGFKSLGELEQKITKSFENHFGK